MPTNPIIHTARAETVMLSLCDEIDYLRHELEASQERERQLRLAYAKLQNDCIQDSYSTIGAVLTHLLKPTMPGAQAKPHDEIKTNQSTSPEA
jgi:hypothetical protein